MFRSKHFIGLFLFVAVATAQPGQQEQRTRSDSATANGANIAGTAPVYIIQPNDVLEIFVWKEPELTRKVLVRPDGRISFPLVQDQPAAGLNPEELKTQIEKRLKDYLDSPNITIIVDAIQSYRVFVTGRVQKPGAIQAEKPITVLQALAMAGGFQEFAKPSEMTLLRNEGGQNVALRFDYDEVIKGRNAFQNILLRPGDVVVVP